MRVVRLGHGANCSSVGSVVDTLFLSAVCGGAILAAICAAMRSESITITGPGAGNDGSGTGGSTEARPDAAPPSSAEIIAPREEAGS